MKLLLQLVMSLAVTLLLTSQCTSAYPRLLCRRNGSNRNAIDPAECKFGWELDACGIKTCTKGPGDLCGGKRQRYGICGEGLMCSACNRCYGCSLKTFQCFEDTRCTNFL